MQDNSNSSKNSIYAFLAVAGIIVISIVGILAFNNSDDSDSEEVVEAETSSSVSSQRSTNQTTANNTNQDSQNTTENNLDEGGEAPTTPAETAGVFADYSTDLLANAEDGNVVIFFNADWCPTCQATLRDINSKLGEIPSDLTILSANYDEELSLRQKYGVTLQHTFVKVDKDGNELAQRSGLDDLEAIYEFSRA